ncbi:RNA dependent RNA polymerase-domain-containing protein [Podospora aff. communis PSN243]|uniref:RNA dependent RNA polymerase-domain-containing protein n=1 Tax=Podospora aff. communis PSN243 TaxID=3040156 RepID=A0AAV9G1D3_9PEZI|nr:RNA dependent RNA polymerase-domain-containing protein [Podospora aff. communis PSN243]
MANAAKKPDPRKYQATLQDTISMSDHEWSYALPNFPAPSDTNKLGLVKNISLKTTGTRHAVKLNFQQASMNRALRSDPLSSFVSISIADFHTRSLRHATGEVIGTQPATPRECTDYVVEMLRSGITLQGIHYNFYGHSNSQLKSRSCFLFAASKEEIYAKVEALGEFSKMKTVQKKAKRIGLLFSSAEVAKIIDPKWCQDIPDIESADYIFTDGCGLIAPKLVRQLADKANITFRNQRYYPSVLQIRYRGYKGVVTVDPRMKEGTPLLRLRKSMKKFNGGDDHSFSVVQSSKPYTFGHLNDEVILLLQSLGIPSETLLRKQREHFQFLANAPNNPQMAFRFLAYVNRFDLAEKVVLESLVEVRPTVQSLVRAEHNRLINKRNEQRCRILIPKSRILFGVCDAWDVLKEGEAQVRITHEGQPLTITNCDVVVTRNPCLHPGDLQKFRAVQTDELSHLVDCIVFSARGKRPAADLMSGGDLDGDTFFVSWDKDIVPSTVSQAAEYPGAREPISFKPITDDDRLVYFARYNNASLGRVKNLYLDWARVRGPMSPQCQELNRLFSTCVDGNRIKVPPKLESPPKPAPESPPFILDELHKAAEIAIKNWQWASASEPVDCGDYSLGTLEVLLSRDDSLVSEFELIQLAWRWCRANNAVFENFIRFFDFNLLSAEQKQWVLSQLPSTVEYPMLIQNALCQSDLLQVSELEDSKLHYPGIRWKRFFSSSEGRIGGFMEAASKALELFHRKLIVFRADERLTFAMYVPRKLEKARDSKVDDNVRLFAFPHSQGQESASRLILPTKLNYHLYYDDNTFQLYEGQRANSWVFITRGASDDSSYRNIEGVRDRRQARQATLDNGTNFDFRTSVALDKFSKRLQTHIGRVRRNGVLAAEVYIITNRDINSLRNLDLWLEYVDTQEVLPLFEQSAKEYSIPVLKDVNWEKQPRFFCQIVKKESLIQLLTLDKIEDYDKLFSFLLEHDQKDLLIRCFSYLLSSFGHLAFLLDQSAVLYQMLGFVHRCPVLAICFTRFESWSALPEPLLDILEANAEVLLKAFVLSANTVGEAVVAPFQTVLERISYLSISTYGRLAELIALTVRSPVLAISLLLGSLERESARLFTARPIIVRYAVKNLAGIAIDHISEAHEQSRTREDMIELKLLPDREDGYPTVEGQFRIDAKGGTPETSAHVRLTAETPPSNSLTAHVYSMDALVISSSPGLAKFKCHHPLPPFLENCSWRMAYCGPFVTAKTMMDAVLTLAVGHEEACTISPLLLGYRDDGPTAGLYLEDEEILVIQHSKLNDSQNAAVLSSLRNPLTCLWGPPGTGKTQTIVEIIKVIQSHHRDVRILVSAPTHNAVDNVMRRYLSDPERAQRGVLPLRVSTEVRKVSDDLRAYTVDAIAGEEIYGNYKAMREAKKRVAQSSLIFTTCIGAGLGLLRSQNFEVVIVDEASQQTEPASLVPLIKGCQKAILVGDHIQLRPTVTPHAAVQEFDISLFERLYTHQDGRVARVMLNTQYRMHKSICGPISKEFYNGELLTGVPPDSRPMFQSQFPWPTVVAPGRSPRMVFLNCDAPENLGEKSKSNKGQAELCLRVCTLLCSKKAQGVPGPATEEGTPSIAVLTPYTKQAQLLMAMLSAFSQVEVCSIDGFQGKEADLVVFVAVRCNPHHEIGFLKDHRRLNVALTRAKTGIVVVGNERTLTMGTEDQESAALWKRLLGNMEKAAVE